MYNIIQEIISGDSAFAENAMGKIYGSLSELIGNTPILELKNFKRNNSLSASVYAKVELFNPAGSIKDRAALEMINDAEEKGILCAGGTVIEPTSGNTGIGLAAICASRGYKLVIVMPDSMSEERKTIMRAFGAELVLTDGVLGMKGAIEKAEELVKKTPGAILAGQFSNPANPAAHYKTTAREIYADMDGDFDFLVATAGTGGTVSGCARYIKEQNGNVKIVAVEPAGSPFITEKRAGAHKIQGIGAGFIPENLDLSLIDQTLTVTDEEAYETTKEIAKTEGLLVGISSGAALAAAKKLALLPENYGKKLVVILPDTGERYLSTGLF